MRLKKQSWQLLALKHFRRYSFSFRRRRPANLAKSSTIGHFPGKRADTDFVYISTSCEQQTIVVNNPLEKTILITFSPEKCSRSPFSFWRSRPPNLAISPKIGHFARWRADTKFVYILTCCKQQTIVVNNPFEKTVLIIFSAETISPISLFVSTSTAVFCEKFENRTFWPVT